MSKIKKICVGIAGALLAAAAVGGIAFLACFPPVKTSSEPLTGRVAETNELRIASYNTAAPWGNALLGTSSARRVKLFSNELQQIAPDSIGVQEINSAWVKKLSEINPNYAYYGIPRDDISSEKQTEMSGIFYLKDKYELLESDTFWISETPEEMSIYPDAGCYRTCSYVVLKNKETGFTYVHLNTHLDNVSTAAQNLGGRLIAQKAQELAEKYGDGTTVVVTGDFNQYVDGEACTVLLDDGFQNASAVNSDAASIQTYHNWGKISESQPIDFIFYAGGLKAKGYTVHNERQGRSYTSDHWCISADFQLNK